MKRILSLILTMTLIISCLTGCFAEEETTTAEEKMKAQITMLYNGLLVSLPDITDIDAQKDYLYDWATKNNIAAVFDTNGNVIMSKKATAGYEEAPATTFHCSLGVGDPLEQYQTMASAMYLINNLENHGFLRILFTPATENSLYGAENLKESYLESETLINLSFAEKTSFTVGSAGTSNYTLSKDLEWISPTYPNAYEISIQGLNGGSSSIVSGSHPNPIKILGNFLASAKSKGVLMELASFVGGQQANQYPESATAVVLINDNDVAKFEKWVNNEIEEFADKYSEHELEYTFTMTPVEEIPQTVISKEESTNVLSLLYTMINGIYLKDEENAIIAVSNIGKINTSDETLTVDICARSLDAAILEEMGTTFEVICGLNDIICTKTNNSSIWVSNLDSPILNTLTDIYKTNFDKDIKNKSIMQNTECSIFKEKNPELDVISVGVNIENNITEIEVIKMYLESLGTPAVTE